MPTSTVDIVNKALNHLAVRPIAALTEDSEPAERAAAIYDSVRDDVLRAYAWGFATKITTLAQISNETVPGWSYLYTYPANCLRVRKLFEDTSVDDAPGAAFREVLTPATNQRAIATNIMPANVEYTLRVVDSTFYDPAFVESLALKLAASLAHHLTGDKTLGPLIQNLYLGSISEAKRLDALERKKIDTSESSYQQARG